MEANTDKITAELVAVDKEMKQPIQPEYKKYILDITQPIADAECLFSIGNIDTLPKGELVAITAKPKQGKSQVQYYLIAAMLANRQLGDVKPLLETYKILLFDTEQSKATLLKVCKRALRLAGLQDDINDNRFCPISLREVETLSRMKIVEEAIREEKPTIVFIDGLADLLLDFNNNIESCKLIQLLLKIATECGCLISCILHQNKGVNETLRGHLGTELLNKVTDCFMVNKKGNKFIVSCLASRNEACPVFSFSINKENNYQVEDAPSEIVDIEDVQVKIRRTLRLCFSERQSMSHKELVKIYMEKGAVKETTAKKHITRSKEEGFLSVTNKQYSISD